MLISDIELGGALFNTRTVCRVFPAGIKKPLPTGRGQYTVANRDAVASPAGRDAPRVAGEPHPALISGTHDGLALEGVSE